MQARVLFATASLTALSLLAVPHAARAQCGGWSPGHGGPGMDDVVRVLATWDDGSGPVAVAGGEFTSAVDVAARHVARWDGARWSALGAGVEFEVHALAGFDDGSGSQLYAGGHLPGIGPVGAAGLARWDGIAWSALARSITGPSGAAVRALAVYDDGSGPALHVAGTFTRIDGRPVERIARWDGQAWTEVGGGIDGPVNALAVYDDGSGPQLVAAGSFDHAGGTTVLDVARWDGNAWSPVGFALLGEVHALEILDDGSGPKLYAGTATTVRSYDGVSWQTPGGNLAREAFSLAVHDDGNGPALHAGTDDGVHRLGPSAWTDLGPLAWSSGSDRIYALQSCARGPLGGRALLAGGRYRVVEPVIAFHGFALERGAWRAFGAGPQERFVRAGGDFAVFDDGGGPALHAGGTTWQSGERPDSQLLRWGGGEWQPVPGSELALAGEGVEALCAHPGSAAIEAGLFLVTSVGSRDLLHFDGRSWNSLGHVPGIGGGEGFVTSMAVFDDGTGGGPSLYVAGELNLMPGWSYGITEWDGTQWVQFNQSWLGIVRALAVFDDGSGPALYLAGSSDVFRWDGKGLSVVGSGSPGGVMALAVYDEGSGPALYAGGDFHSAGGRPARHLARWDGKAWSEVGGGLTSDATWFSVGGLGVFYDGARSVLVVAGQFSAAGGVSAVNAATWDGSTWSPMGAGLGSSGYSLDLIQHDLGPTRTLWVRGPFNTAGEHAAWGIARWRDECPSSPLAYCTAKLNSQGCAPTIGWRGSPSAGAQAQFLVTARQVINQRVGLFFYGLQGQAAVPLQGGTLCVASPVRRTPLQWSGGNPPPDDCSGSLALDFNAWIRSGSDPGLVAGAQARGQYWYRDAASPGGSGLSDAIAFQIGP